MTQTQQTDIFIEQGVDWEYEFPIPAEINLVNASAAMQIRTRTGSTFIATLTSAGAQLTINAGRQSITAKIAYSLTEGFIPDDYVYDLKVADVSNKRYRPHEGNATIDPQVTVVALPVSANNPITTEDGIGITTEDGQKITT